MQKELLKRLNLPESYVSIALGFIVVIVAGLILINNFSSQQTQEVGEVSEISQEAEEINIPSDLPTSHTVAANENLWTIAQKYYKSGYNWVDIAQANNLANPDMITVNLVLNIPKAETILPEGEQVTQPTIQEPKNYTVVQGDNLWKIAVKEYSDGYAWVKIAQENNLINPDIIYPGNVLKLPQV